MALLRVGRSISWGDETMILLAFQDCTRRYLLYRTAAGLAFLSSSLPMFIHLPGTQPFTAWTTQSTTGNH
jgi:hypothetical protein